MGSKVTTHFVILVVAIDNRELVETIVIDEVTAFGVVVSAAIESTADTTAHATTVEAPSRGELFCAQTRPKGGSRRKNRTPDKGEPYSTTTNNSGTIIKNYDENGNT